ncbi:hypothetical protein Pla144_04440 [Bythopirellula polymerisocia]|uniref:Uncharacterized protein n=1 Tax=Bythopirellula polymerisocia TaxID=2528003 RepID=A0A5C6D0H8_9BACT|nr:hypothetical protein Pla144_04440 [Bythopirellula polymerisocia]
MNLRGIVPLIKLVEIGATPGFVDFFARPLRRFTLNAFDTLVTTG